MIKNPSFEYRMHFQRYAVPQGPKNAQEKLRRVQQKIVDQDRKYRTAKKEATDWARKAARKHRANLDDMRALPKKINRESNVVDLTRGLTLRIGVPTALTGTTAYLAHKEAKKQAARRRKAALARKNKKLSSQST